MAGPRAGGDGVAEDVKAVSGILAKLKSTGIGPVSDLSDLANLMTRITAGLAMEGLGYVDFHGLDDDLAEGKIDPRFVPAIKRSTKLASPALFPSDMNSLALTLEQHLARLEKAILGNELENARRESSGAHEAYHELQTKVAEWLRQP